MSKNQRTNNGKFSSAILTGFLTHPFYHKTNRA